MCQGLCVVQIVYESGGGCKQICIYAACIHLSYVFASHIFQNHDPG